MGEVVSKNVQNCMTSLTIDVRHIFATFEPSFCAKVASAGGPRYLRTFYLRIRLFTIAKIANMIIFQSKNDFLFVNSIFMVQNDGTYQP
jgi:hypothetical protein